MTIRSVLITSVIISLTSCKESVLIDSDDTAVVTPGTAVTPPLGWSSFDGYCTTINESKMLQELDAFKEKLKPAGYEYFVIDNGWADDDNGAVIDEYGRNTAAPHLFPSGMKSFVDKAHAMNIKVGLWVVRGINREAVNKNLPIFGTPYFASEIANKSDTSDWCNHNYGVDMSKPGAQEYYNSKIALIASWGVDFLKYDDMTLHPDEIRAVKKAIELTGRSIYLSISPGDSIPKTKENIESFKMANCLRITADSWDNRGSIQHALDRWDEMQGYANSGYSLDLDILPVGYLFRLGERRMDLLTTNQKMTVFTMRAMAASPIFFGGSLLYSDQISLDMARNSEMLKCNQNGLCARRVYRIGESGNGGIDFWNAADVQNSENGWFGIFNRSKSAVDFTIPKSKLGLKSELSYSLLDIWTGETIADKAEMKFSIGPDGVVFVKYVKK